MNVDEIWEFRLKHFLYKGLERNCYVTLKDTFPWVLKDICCLTHYIDTSASRYLLQEIEHYWPLAVHKEAIVFAMAALARSNDPCIKSEAFAVAKKLFKTPENLFLFSKYLEEMHKNTGWGRSRKCFVNNWYTSLSPQELAENVTQITSKYQWKHCDLIKLAHTQPQTNEQGIIFTFLIKGLEWAIDRFEKMHSPPECKGIVDYLRAVREVKRTNDVHLAARLIEIHNLTLEHVPSTLLKSKEIWCALIPRMPIAKLLKQLPRLYRLNLLKSNGAIAKLFVEQLQCESLEGIATINPLELFLTRQLCEEIQRHQTKATPFENKVQKTELEDSIQAIQLSSLQSLPPTKKRFLVTVDISKISGQNKIKGSKNLTIPIASAFVLMALSQTEGSGVTAMAFSNTGIQPIDINNKMNICDIRKRMSEIPVGVVNLALPAIWAMENKRPVDVFLTLTDNQPQLHDIHPADALKKYQSAMNLPDSRMIVCGMTNAEFCLAPEDKNMLVIAGFDKNVLKVIRDFANCIF